MRLIKKLTVLLLAVCTVHTAFGFSLIGPFKGYQVPVLGYNLPGDIGGPMTLTEAYRWNVPVVTYAFDESFIRYFGTNGMNAAEQALKLLGDVFPVSQIPVVTNIGAFGETTVSFLINGEPAPNDSRGENLTASSLGLLDLKSQTLAMLVEQMGLSDPERWTYALRARSTFTINNQTFTNYITVINNYDPISLKPTNVVNGKTVHYSIFDPIQPGNYADAVEFFDDPLNPYNPSTVASGSDFGILPGIFYQRLTRDDVGGLRYLYNTNNLVTERLLNTGNTTITRGTASANGGLSPWTILIGPTNLVSTNSVLFTNSPFGGTNLVDAAIRPGVDRITFFRVNFDSLIGQGFTSITNIYTDRFVTNARFVTQPLQRAIFQPDILFVAADLGLFGNPQRPIPTLRTSTAGWVNNDGINGQANQGGPGVITPPIRFSFTDQFPYFENETPRFIDNLQDNTARLSGAWGSFDGSTNAPIVYPEFLGLSLEQIRAILSTNTTTIIRSN
jgi:hypothetical protein